jgi:small-conductance mechanosensitive channel/CRP-like cAMP-binding protein
VDATSETVGVGIAVVLVVGVRALLPAGSRRRIRGPLAMLVLHGACRAVLAVVADDSPAEPVASVLALALLLASIGRSAVLLALDVIATRHLARRVPKIFGDIIQSVVYAAILLVALRDAGVAPGELFTTSALVTAAIALSLQETLGNVVAGLAIQMQRPFDVDDWIQFDTELKHIGRVLEINWRATKVLTLDDVEIIVPNATLAKASVTNFTKPTAASRRSLYVQVPASVDPAVVRAAIAGALPGGYGVLADPAPSVVLNQFVDGNTEYWVRFYTALFDKRDGVDGAARERVWYGLARAGIPIAAPGRAIALREVTADSETRDREAELVMRAHALRRVDFLRALSTQQLGALAAASRMHRYGGGEPVVAQGDTTAEMFVVERGRVAVERDGREVASLGIGEFFGEMALMTGEVRTATVRASEPSTLIGLEQHAVKALLDGAPELAAAISQAIAARHAAITAARESSSGIELATVEERSSQLLARIKRFFAL